MPQAQPNPTPTKPGNPLTDSGIRVCPDCAGPIARTAGCISCLHCGWGRCG